MEPLANWRRAEPRKRWRRCLGKKYVAEALATDGGAGRCRAAGRSAPSAVIAAMSGWPAQKRNEYRCICKAPLPGGPNVGGEPPAEAGRDWPRKDNVRSTLKRPGAACRSGSARPKC